MNGISPWAALASSTFADEDLAPLYTRSVSAFTFNVCLSPDSLWINASFPNGGDMMFRAAFSAAGPFTVTKTTENEQGIDFVLSSVIGETEVNIKFSEEGQTILRYTTSLKPNTDLLIPFWPRDIVIPGKNGNAQQTAGKVHVSQVGTRSGLIYMSMTRPKAGSVLYLQNLTALTDYCQQTETSCAEVVGGEWPELGFALPPAKDKPLKAQQKVIIGDAIIAFDEEVPAKESAIVNQYLNLLAAVYLELPRPGTTYQHWPEILNIGLKDLIENHGCWSQVGGNAYLNAYVSDYKTPPEIMVQLAVLLPLMDYIEWSGTELHVMKNIKEGLPAFYNEKLGTVMRWHPALAEQLEGEEEQKQPMVMDSWYLHHPLLNLSRLALKGDKTAEKLFMDSLEFAIKVARHFKYQWPVFYKMDTLEVVKEETQPGKGGEKDVAGLYAHVMLQAYELTGDKKYLQEAEKAAKTLEGMGFDLFYQANNTTFSAGALLRLWKITKKELYLELSYLCLANVFKNVHLWDCNYGYGKNFPSFFAIFPLSDAPYTAAYEEQEVYCALHDYLAHAEGEDILPSVSLLIAEFVRYLIERAVYYYPAMLPQEMLSEDVKTGEVDRKLWIALEDLHDGWEQSGEVGQEVYGAGNAFGILPRHYIKVPGEDFMIYIDYPTADVTVKKNKTVSFTVKGDKRLSCRMMIIPQDNAKLPVFTVKNKEELKGKQVKEGRIEYTLNGDQQIKISW
jgi:hypothetical protein